jgi:hypothetical protein
VTSAGAAPVSGVLELEIAKARLIVTRGSEELSVLELEKAKARLVGT